MLIPPTANETARLSALAESIRRESPPDTVGVLVIVIAPSGAVVGVNVSGVVAASLPAILRHVAGSIELEQQINGPPDD
jgi:hypothetical protein